jgi:hypothetical protein
MKVGSSLSWMWMLSRGDRENTGTGCWAVISRVSGFVDIVYRISRCI